MWLLLMQTPCLLLLEGMIHSHFGPEAGMKRQRECDRDAGDWARHGGGGAQHRTGGLPVRGRALAASAAAAAAPQRSRSTRVSAWTRALGVLLEGCSAHVQHCCEQHDY